MVSRQRLDLPGATTALQRRQSRQEKAANLGFSSITRGGMRVQSPEGIRVNQVPGGAAGLRVTGVQLVDGTLRISGVLEGGGTFSWSGTIDQIGATTLRGPVSITGQSGSLTVAAETVLQGLTRILANLQVEADGQITVGGVRLLPGSGGQVIVDAGGRIIIQGADGDTVLNNSKITFPNGTTVSTEGDGVVISQDGVSVGIVGGVARMRNGTRTLSVFSGGFSMTGLPTVPMSTRPGSFVGAVIADNVGSLSRVVAG